MVRVLAYIILVFLLAACFAWLADRPGAVILTWQNYEIRASLMVAAVALVAVIATLAGIGAVLRGIFNMPGMLGRFFGARRRERGYRALSAGTWLGQATPIRALDIGRTEEFPAAPGKAMAHLIHFGAPESPHRAVRLSVRSPGR